VHQVGDKNKRTIRYSFKTAAAAATTTKQQQQLQAVSSQRAASAQSNGLHLADSSDQKTTQRRAHVYLPDVLACGFMISVAEIK
jgi:hypothetical protein